MAEDRGRVPTDLAVLTLLVALAPVATFAPVVGNSPLRVAFGVCLALFLPGYAIVSALFPRESDDPAGGIDAVERVALGVVLSAASVSLVVLALVLTPWGVAFGPALAAVGGLTAGATALAVVRRASVPRPERFGTPIGETVRSVRRSVAPDSGLAAVANVVLALALTFALAGVGYAVVGQDSDGAFSEFYVLSAESAGGPTAEDYPTSFTRGETRRVEVTIGNYEHRAMAYMVVVVVQRDANVERTSLVDVGELARYDVELAHGESDRRQVALEPTTVGERLRITFRLYDRATSEVRDGEPYRQVHFWVTVTERGVTDHVSQRCSLRARDDDLRRSRAESDDETSERPC